SDSDRLLRTRKKMADATPIRRTRMIPIRGRGQRKDPGRRGFATSVVGCPDSLNVLTADSATTAGGSLSSVARLEASGATGNRKRETPPGMVSTELGDP